MAIASTNKLVVVKAFAPGNPLPLDAREIHESLAAAQAYAASSPIAYVGQTIKVVEDGAVTAYILAPSDVEGENFKLQYVAGGASGNVVHSVGVSELEGMIQVYSEDGGTQDIPVNGVLLNPVVDEEAHTLTLSKVTAEGTTKEVVIPLGGASPATVISGVKQVEDGLAIEITKFDVETETESTEVINIAGAVDHVGIGNGVVTVKKWVDGAEEDITYSAMVGSVIDASYDSTNKVLTLPVVTGVDGDQATTRNVTVDLKAVTAGAYTNVAVTADTETESGKFTFTYKDATGAEQTKTIYETGARKVEAGSTADKLKVTTADTTGALTSTEILIGAGSVKNPEYDSETRKITLPVLQADGTTQDLEINLGKDMVVKSGSYNEETDEIILVLTDDSEVKIPAASLVDVYTGDATATVTVTVSDDNVVTAALKVSAVEGNLLKVGEDGVYVVESDFVATKQLIVNAQAAAEKHADDAVAAAKTEVNKYTDDAIAAEVTARDNAIAAAKTEVNGYTDDAIEAEVEARDAAIAAAKTEVNGYTDDAVAGLEEKVTEAVLNLATSTNESLATEKRERIQGDADTLAAAKAYADSVASTASTTWVDFGA